jgi:hypothetical protein
MLQQGRFATPATLAVSPSIWRRRPRVRADFFDPVGFALAAGLGEMELDFIA